MSLANIIAPAIGGYLYGVSPRLPFLVSGILFIVITITIFMYIFSHKKSTLSA